MPARHLVVAVVALVVAAGCVTTVPSNDTDGSGTVAFYVSDQANDIDNFDRLQVTITRVGLRRTNGNWTERQVENVTVALTRLQGANATLVDAFEAPNGSYDTAFLRVGETNATLVDGSDQEVQLPSGRLQLNSGFTVGANESVDFVFDITVRKAGNSGKYVLQPVATESGTDVPIERRGPNGERMDDDADDAETLASPTDGLTAAA